MIIRGVCPICKGPLEHHSIHEIRITEKTIYVSLDYMGNPRCEFVGMVIS